MRLLAPKKKKIPLTTNNDGQPIVHQKFNGQSTKKTTGVLITFLAPIKVSMFFLLSIVYSSNHALDKSKSTKLLRYPDIYNNRVVFTYAGDLWTVSTSGDTATRITAHKGLELFPKFSPDGHWVAFTGQYDGDEQVYIIPSKGGTPQRLTAYPAWDSPMGGYDNQVVGWTPNSESVVFRSHRGQPAAPYSRLYTVSIDKSLPQPLPMLRAGTGVFSPEGNHLLFSPEARDFRTWKRYRGGWAKDLWIYDIKANQAKNITKHKGTDRDPIWTKKGIYFVSERQGKMNLFSLDHKGNNLQQVTHHKGDVRWASGDLAGNIIYEFEGNLRLYDESEIDRALEIWVPDDGIHSRPHYVEIEDFIENYDLSPNGKRVALTARGDVFSIPKENGPYLNLTRSDSHERMATWSPDGKTVAYVSDASGEEEIWLVNADGSHPRQLTHDNERRFYGLNWSPNGQQLATSDHNANLYVISLSSGILELIGEIGAWHNQDYVWSPDSRYLAYSNQEPSSLHSIFIWSRTGGSLRVTPEDSNEFNPMWHHSGDYLYFLADRNFSPLIGRIEWNYAVNRATTVNGLALRKSIPSPFLPISDSASNSLPQDDNDGNSDKEKRTKDKTIDFDHIFSRVFRVPLESNNYKYATIKGDTLYLVASGDVYYGRDSPTSQRLISYSIPDQKRNVLAKYVDGVNFSESAVLIQKNSKRFEIHNLIENTHSTLNIGGVKKWVNPQQEWATVFDEVWRRFRDFFYVRNMHGNDWKAIGDHYRKLLPYVAHRSDLNYVIGEMISELNVGHAFIFGGDQYHPERPVPNLLGVTFKLDIKNNRYQIHKILSGDNTYLRYRSPLTDVGVNISEGDYLLAINGIELTASDNPYEVLRRAQHSGKAINLSISREPNAKAARNQLINPLASETSLHYFNWVEKNRQTVTQRSKGRLGYIHLPDMSTNGLFEFVRSYYGQIRKDGLVIDVRGNLGDSVSQMILERLLRKSYSLGYIQGDQHVKTYPWGNGWPTFTGEIAVLVDETTLSDGEAFSWSFQQSKRGPIVGRRTWGGVIGVGETGVTVDGGQLRVPQYALADMKGHWVVEGEGVIPDIEVDNQPTDLVAGQDKQLETIVQELLNTLGNKKPGHLPKAAQDPVR